MNSLPFFIVALVGMGISVLFVRLILRHCKRTKSLVRPAEIHHARSEPIPRFGGVALALAFLGVEALLFFAMPGQRTEVAGWHAIVFASIAMFVLGLWDDLWGLGARKKLLGQVLIAAALCWSGIVVEVLRIPLIGHKIELHEFGVVITIFWLVGMTNLINLLDGADGLAGGICLMLMVLLAVLGHQIGGVQLSAAGMAGALLGFLWYNFPPAKIYLGDGGAYLLGFQIAAFSLVDSRKGEVFAALSAPLFVLVLPILDTTLTIVRRAVWGLSVFRADRRHLHHQLERIGFSRRKVVLSFYGVTLVFLALGFASIWLRGEWLPGLLGIGALVLILCATNLSFSRAWFDVEQVLGNSLGIRKEIKYALSLMHWLQLDGSRCASLDELWVDFAYCARKLRFSSAKLTLADRQRVWVEPNRCLPTRSARHFLHGGGSGVLELEAPACEFPSPECQVAGETKACGAPHCPGMHDPRLFEVLAELLAEGWLKAAQSWGATQEAASRLTPAVIPVAATSTAGSPLPCLRPRETTTPSGVSPGTLR